jgi:hypothetical protein
MGADCGVSYYQNYGFILIVVVFFNGGKFLVLTLYFARVLLFDFEMLGKFVVFQIPKLLV